MFVLFRLLSLFLIFFLYFSNPRRFQYFMCLPLSSSRSVFCNVFLVRPLHLCFLHCLLLSAFFIFFSSLSFFFFQMSYSCLIPFAVFFLTVRCLSSAPSPLKFSFYFDFCQAPIADFNSFSSVVYPGGFQVIFLDVSILVSCSYSYFFQIFLIQSFLKWSFSVYFYPAPVSSF